MAHRPRKRFGQNFLHDQSVILKILSAINTQAGDRLVEIGPGKGALTYPLLQETGTLEVIELDRDLILPLEKQSKKYGQLHIHNADALDFDFCSMRDSGKPLRVVGNLPYNISTPLIFHLLDQTQCINDMHFMLQKEVVDRLSATPGTSAYSRLSIMVQYRCKVEHLFTVGAQAFTPPPRVESAFVRLTPYPQPPVTVNDEEIFSHIVTLAFSQRRKTIRNSLKTLLSSEEIRSENIDPGLRAERLTLADFACLSNLLFRRESRISP